MENNKQNKIDKLIESGTLKKANTCTNCTHYSEGKHPRLKCFEHMFFFHDINPGHIMCEKHNIRK